MPPVAVGADGFRLGFVLVSARSSSNAATVAQTPAQPRPLVRRWRRWRRSAMRWWRLPFPPWIGVATVAVGLGIWGFTLLVNSKKTLDFFQSVVAAFGLFGISLGAGGVTGVHPPWQIGVAAVLAAGLTVRAFLALMGGRIRGWYIKRRLRGHVIVCGAGALGTQLAGVLDKHHDVVLIDINPAAVGLAMAPDRYVWPLRGDAALPETLGAAGIRAAAELLAVTSDDYVNSRIVTAADKLSGRGEVSSRLRVLVRVEDPGLTRFFEEQIEEGHAVERGGPLRVNPFSTNAVAARALLVDGPCNRNGSAADGQRDDHEVCMEIVDGNAPHLLLVGDHPFLDSVILEALRRWRALALGWDQGVEQPPVRVSLYGPDAIARAERFRNRWAPEPQLLDLYSQDLPIAGFGAEPSDKGLIKLRGRKARGGKPGDYVSYAIVACDDELDGVALALGVGRALGDAVPLVRVSMLGPSTLDNHIEQQTKASRHRSTTRVKSVAELACDRDAIRSHSSGEDRLIDELVKRRHALDSAQSSVGRLFLRSDLDIHTDPAWHFSELEVPMLKALLEADQREDEDDGISLDAVVAAGLAINFHSEANLLAAAERLIARGETANAFPACCEYARITGDWRALAQATTRLADAAGEGCQADHKTLAIRVLELRRAVLLPDAVSAARERLKKDPHDGSAKKELECCEDALRRSRLALRAACSQLRGGQDDLLGGYTRVAIFAGGANPLSEELAQRLSELLGPREALLEADRERIGGQCGEVPLAAAAIGAAHETAGTPLPKSKRPQVLERFDGVVLCGPASGISGVVAKAAKGYGIATVAYARDGKVDDTLYRDVRQTDGSDFSAPLAMWTDILAAGIPPDRVGLVAVPGGQISHSEILLARALGATAGWIDPLSEQPLPLGEMLPGGNEDILELPADAMSIRALIYSTELDDPKLREHVAKQAHAEYRANQLGRKPAGDPALAPWERLLPLFKSSNLGQADDIKNKLAMIRLRIVLKSEGGRKLELTVEEVELLAEMEHGRYVVERLQAGWQQGDRDANRRLSPYFKPWDDLGKEKESDREAVRRIAGALDSLGYGVTELEN
jgi:hypothetical protein